MPTIGAMGNMRPTTPAPSPAWRGMVLGLAFVLLVAAGCSLNVNTLGGREKCWPESPPRAASLWRGILRIDAFGGRLETPEGDIIPLLPGTLTTRTSTGVGELVRGSNVVARAGDDVTLFGGAGSDGGLVVCAVEEVHSGSSRGTGSQPNVQPTTVTLSRLS